jgi:sugar/nucleoside kinase (ribokinase family)
VEAREHSPFSRRKSARRVLAVGDINADIILSGLSTLPRSEQEILATGFDVVTGGQTGTIARTLSRLGASVAFVGRVGNDAYGKTAIDQLKQDGVNTSGIIIDPGSRTGTTIVLSTGSERAYVTFSGSIGEVRRSDIDNKLLRSADHLHVGSYYLQEKLRPELAELFREAEEAGLTTSLDPGWDPANEWDTDILDVLRYVDVFLPNQVEAMRITGSDEADKALSVLGDYASLVIIKLGEKGCLIRSKQQTIHFPGFKVPVVDVTSAGDIFNAGFLYGILCGWSLSETARFANACGAISVSKVGSAGIIAGEAEVRAFLASRDDHQYYPQR